MSSETNIFDCLLEPAEMFDLYRKIGTILNNERDIINERIQGKSLRNTLALLLEIKIIQQSEAKYSKQIVCSSFDSFFDTLMTQINSIYRDIISEIVNCPKHYDDARNQFYIYVNDIPLKYMGLVMLMEQHGVFARSKTKEYFVGIDGFQDIIQRDRPLVSIEELQKRLQRNAENGRLAEEFAVRYEVRRLLSIGIEKSPQRISDIDVTAGYDIVSYEDGSSEIYDRFIEVKAISRDCGFFWSKNELEAAEIKREKYYLYLIDLSSINDPSYDPIIIPDPANRIMTSPNWLVEPQSYRIRRI